MLRRRLELPILFVLLERFFGPLVTVPLALGLAIRRFIRWRRRGQVLAWVAVIAVWALLDAVMPGWLAAAIVIAPLARGYYLFKRAGPL